MPLRSWKVDPNRERPWKTRELQPLAAAAVPVSTSDKSENWPNIDVTDASNFDILVQELGKIEKIHGKGSVQLLPPVALAVGCLQHMKNLKGAERYASKGLRIAKNAGDKEWEAMFLRRLSQLQAHSKNIEAGEAAVHIAKAFPAAERDCPVLESLLAAARACMRSGDARMAHHQIIQIRSVLEDSTAHKRKVDARYDIETHILNAEVLNTSGRYAEAEASAEEAMKHARALTSSTKAPVDGEQFQWKRQQMEKNSKVGRSSRSTGAPSPIAVAHEQTRYETLLLAATRVLRAAVVGQQRFAEADTLCAQTIATATALHGETSGRVAQEHLEQVDVLVLDVRARDAVKGSDGDGTDETREECNRRLQKRRMARKEILSRAYAAATRATVVHTDVHGHISLETAYAMAQTAEVCSLLENHSEAIDLQKEAVHILNEMYGPDHTYTLTETAVLTVLGDRAHKDRHLPLVQNADVCVAGEVGDTSKRRASSVHPLRSSSDNSKDVNTSYARAHRGTTERPKDTESRVSKQSPTTDKSRTFIKETGGQRRDIRDITVVVDDASSDYDGSSANDYDGSSGGSDDEGDDRMTTPDFALYPPCSYLNCLMVETDETPFPVQHNGHSYCSTECQIADTQTQLLEDSADSTAMVTAVYSRPFVKGCAVDENVSAILSSMGNTARHLRVRRFHHNAYFLQTGDDGTPLLVRITRGEGVAVRVWNGWRALDDFVAHDLRAKGLHAASSAIALLLEMQDRVHDDAP